MKIPAFCSALVLASSTFAAAAEAVSNCGQTVLDGVLAADLDCSVTPGFAVTIADGGSLDFAGHHVVSGPVPETGYGGAVRCLGDCTIQGGGGVITNFTPWDWSQDATLATGVLSEYPLHGHVSINGLSISGYETAAYAFDLRLQDCTLSGNFSGVFGRTVHVDGSEISNTEHWGHQSIGGRYISVTDSVLTGGGGITAFRFEAYRSVITGMRDAGVSALGNRKLKRLYLEDSSVEGNCVGPSGEYCGDLLSTMREPILVDSTCGTSVRYFRRAQSWGSWGICSLD